MFLPTIHQTYPRQVVLPFAAPSIDGRNSTQESTKSSAKLDSAAGSAPADKAESSDNVSSVQPSVGAMVPKLSGEVGIIVIVYYSKPVFTSGISPDQEFLKLPDRHGEGSLHFSPVDM